MVSNRSPLLTETQWRVLTGKEEEMEGSDRRAHKSRARKRVKGILRDFAYLYGNISQDDREQIFENLDDFRAHREAKLIAERNAARESERQDRERTATVDFPEPAPAAEDGKNLYEGLVGLLAFMYGGVNDNGEFERMIERAIRAERQRKSLLPLKIDASISLVREDEAREVLNRFKQEEISEEEALMALQKEDALNDQLLTDFVFSNETGDVNDEE